MPTRVSNNDTPDEPTPDVAETTPAPPVPEEVAADPTTPPADENVDEQTAVDAAVASFNRNNPDAGEGE